MRFVILFLALPILEIALFIQVGRMIGLWPTLGLVILSSILGLAVIRRQGMQTIARLRESVEAGRDPAGPLADGALVFVAGVLLLVPGFFTGALGLVLLLPPVRAALIRRAAAGVVARTMVFGQRPAPRPRGAAGPGEAIEADYEVLDDVPPSQRGASGWTRPQ